MLSKGLCIIFLMQLNQLFFVNPFPPAPRPSGRFLQNLISFIIFYKAYQLIY